MIIFIIYHHTSSFIHVYRSSSIINHHNHQHSIHYHLHHHLLSLTTLHLYQPGHYQHHPLSSLHNIINIIIITQHLHHSLTSPIIIHHHPSPSITIITPINLNITSVIVIVLNDIISPNSLIGEGGGGGGCISGNGDLLCPKYDKSGFSNSSSLHQGSRSNCSADGRLFWSSVNILRINSLQASEMRH